MAKESNGFGVTSLVLGIISIVSGLLMPYIAIILGPLAIVFAVMQRRKHKNSVATGGLVTGIIGTALSAIMLIIVIVAILAFGV